MTQDNLARDRTHDPAPAEGDALYDALVAALRSNARGRAFLDEYARRSRAADTAAALEALARIEALLTRERATTEGSEIAPDEAHAPLELDLLPDTAATLAPPRRASADLLAQVMALSPEERIALFS